MLKCEHDIVEVQTAVGVDGLCPLCLQAENKEQKELIDWLCSQEPCPKCGYGVTVACYGCEIKQLKETIKHIEQALRDN